jgi:hypothetical protein
MKKIATVGLLGTILAITVGFISTNSISAIPFLTASTELSPHEFANMIGHVEYVVRGTDGQIKQYVQGDNVIVNRGTDCAAQAIFNPAENIANIACDFSLDGFSFIAIGNGTHVDDATQLQLVDDTGGADCDGVSITDDTCEMDRKAATVKITPAGIGSTVVTVETPDDDPFTFNHGDNNGAPNGEIRVTESGLFDSGTPFEGNMFSVRGIAGGGVAVTNADTLSVTWTITLSTGT